jgi:hypothetical protein
MQKARSQEPDHPKVTASLLPLVGTRFQDLFHRPSGLLFTFPSRYWCTIGHGFVFSLGGWSPQIQTGFLVSRPTQVPVPLMTPMFRLRGSHPVSRSVPARFDYTDPTRGVKPPHRPYNPESSWPPV